MKAHEHTTRQYLPRRTWTIMRLDGRAFHTYTRGLQRPFDAEFAATMDAVAARLASEVTGTAFTYTQSDEISLLVTDFASVNTEAWFAGNVQKMTSLSAALATATFNQLRPSSETGKTALFDSRVFTLADPHEVAAYFTWRQRDCVKNSISMAAQTHFSHQALQGLHAGKLQDKLFTEAGVNWNDYPDGFKRGRVSVRRTYTEPVTWTHKRTGETHTEVATRSRWETQPAPHFNTDVDGWLLATAIPRMPSRVRTT